MRNSLISRSFNSNPFSLIEDFENDLTRIFGNFGPGLKDPSFLPALDLIEGDEHYILSVDLPGVKKEDIEVEVKDNILRVSGERKSQLGLDGRFERSFKLGPHIKMEDIKAHYENGVLSLAIPKKGNSTAKKIEIKSGEKESFWNKLLGKKDEGSNKELAS